MAKNITSREMDFLLPWEFEEEHIEEMPLDGTTYIPARLWGTKPDGDLTLIAQFAVPVNKKVVKLILAAGKLLSIATVRGFLR